MYFLMVDQTLGSKKFSIQCEQVSEAIVRLIRVHEETHTHTQIPEVQVFLVLWPETIFFHLSSLEKEALNIINDSILDNICILNTNELHRAILLWKIISINIGLWYGGKDGLLKIILPKADFYLLMWFNILLQIF